MQDTLTNNATSDKASLTRNTKVSVIMLKTVKNMRDSKEISKILLLTDLVKWYSEHFHWTNQFGRPLAVDKERFEQSEKLQKQESPSAV